MQVVSSQAAGQDRRQPPEAADRTRFLLALSLIAIVGFGIRFSIAWWNYLDVDEWQHVFIAASPRLADLQYELNLVAHPPLFFWILRGLLHVGHGPITYRITSILSGVGPIFLIGLICRKLCRNQLMPLVAALAFSLSGVAITVSSEVRSYQLSTFFSLLAFYFFLKFFKPDEGRRGYLSYFGFAVAMCVAVATHYSAVFALGACAAIAGLFIPANTRLQAHYKSPLRLTLLALSFAIPAGLMVFFLTSVTKQPIQGYLYLFYWGYGPKELLPYFIARNIGNEWNIFSPIYFQQAKPALACTAVLFVVGASLWLRILDTSKEDRRARIPYPFFLVMVCEIIGLSLLDLYPFGGQMRHQFLLLPFLLIAVFSLLDGWVSTATWRVAKKVPLVLAGFVALNLAVNAKSLLPHPGWIISRGDYLAFNAAVPQAPGVYLSHFTVIQYFEMTDAYPRKFVRRVNDGSNVIDEYTMTWPDGRTTELFYDKSRERPDLQDPPLYRSFAACMKDAGIPEIGLFYLVPGYAPLPLPPDDLEKNIRKLAANQGLTVSSIAIFPKSRALFAGFKPQ